MTTAIYYQKSEVVQEEFKLIEVATLREMVVEKLQRVIREVKERRRECDDAAILETMMLFNKVREATIDIIRSISIWQESFTTPIRPRLLDCDYIVDRLIGHIDFINSTTLKRIFNFQFYRGNFLLLPYPNPKTVEPVRISTALGREIRAFASPPEETVLYCYQFMINCVPDEVYQNKVAPLKRWLMAGWIPRVWVMDAKPPPPAPLKRQASKSAGVTASVNNSRRSSTVGAASTGSFGGPKSNEDAAGALPPVTTSPGPSSRPVRRRSTLGSSNSGLSGEKGLEGGPARTRIKRRNQKKEEETAQLKAIVMETDSPQQGNSSSDLQALQLEEYLRVQREKKEKEMSGLDTYFKEMELLFLPTLGRRAVQTVLVGGTRTDENKEYHEPVTHDLFHQPDKIVFHHTTKEESDLLQAIVTDTFIPEDSNRVNGALVSKRNRIMADRGQPTQDRKYEKHQQQADFSSYKRKFDRSALLSSHVEANPMEILFAVSDPEAGKVLDKEAQSQSEKMASAYLKNKYHTGPVRAKSKESGDGSSEGTRSRKVNRRPSGVTVDSHSQHSLALDDAASEHSGKSTEKSVEKSGEALSEDVPPPPADTPNSRASEAPSSADRGNTTNMKTASIKGALSPLSVPGCEKGEGQSRKGAAASPASAISRGSAKGRRRSVSIEVQDAAGAYADAAADGEGGNDAPSSPGGQRSEGEEVASRRHRRRESRRMSDLTVTFSEMGDPNEDTTFEVLDEVPAPVGRGDPFPGMGGGMSGRIGSPAQRSGSAGTAQHPHRERKHSSPPRRSSPLKATGRPQLSPLKGHPSGDSLGASDRFKASAVRSDGKNEYAKGQDGHAT